MILDKVMLTKLVYNLIAQSYDKNGDGEPTGLIGMLGKKGQEHKKDIPAIFECLTLLEHYLSTGTKFVRGSPSINKSFNEEQSFIICDDSNEKLVLLIHIEDGDLPYFASWSTNFIQSSRVLSMAGVYAIPFSLEIHEDRQFIFPEWCHAFFVNGDSDQCYPVFVLKSMETITGSDFSLSALYRLQSYNLPVERAIDIITSSCHSRDNTRH